MLVLQETNSEVNSSLTLLLLSEILHAYCIYCRRCSVLSTNLIEPTSKQKLKLFSEIEANLKSCTNNHYHFSLR